MSRVGLGSSELRQLSLVLMSLVWSGSVYLRQLGSVQLRLCFVLFCCVTSAETSFVLLRFGGFRFVS